MFAGGLGVGVGRLIEMKFSEQGLPGIPFMSGGKTTGFAVEVVTALDSLLVDKIPPKQGDFEKGLCGLHGYLFCIIVHLLEFVLLAGKDPHEGREMGEKW